MMIEQIVSGHVNMELFSKCMKLTRQNIIMREFIAQEGESVDIAYVKFLHNLKLQPEFTEFSDVIEEDIESLEVTYSDVEDYLPLYIVAPPIPN